jgi:hypothetical protein
LRDNLQAVEELNFMIPLKPYQFEPETIDCVGELPSRHRVVTANEHSVIVGHSDFLLDPDSVKPRAIEEHEKWR